ncbi:S1-like domain-containing RNA-binding protein [Peptoniphilus equinus]|uniref:S1-like domain-containing RNA-binding protein n=1 Tax=Peptoniphilus equinus TaxID=3016343 RepID=A0ABY7QRR4_9FIRM|nr:S1-like domain-containing RNA-binding protein [Peptoniphilus equinus]WBW49464.1 S1-like domain-containing RNA-binding protein [Peptoniphilus equinus]
MKLGRHQLTVVKTKPVVLSDGNETIELREERNLPVGDNVSAFVYDCGKDRRVATLERPFLEIGEVQKLTVVDKTGAGYFVNIGLDKDIFLPYQERVGRIEVGQAYLMTLYIDRSDRLCVSMDIKEKLLKNNGHFAVNDMVKGTVYQIDGRGAHVAIYNKYDGLVLKEEVKGILTIGEEVEARISRIVKDGRITLTLREKAYKQMHADADLLLELIEDNGGVLPLGDKSDPDLIKDITGLSKSAFKRAEGALYKAKKINLYPNKIELKHHGH